MSSPAAPRSAPSLLQRAGRLFSDQRFLSVFFQLIFFFLIMLLLIQVWNSIYSALDSRNLTPNFDFMNNRAGFEIGGAGDYSPDDAYWAAFTVGLRNTLTVVAAGLVGATLLGVLAGILLLSRNWLVRSITRGIVEVLRNTPLLVQIFVAFFVVVLALPSLRESIQVPPEGILFIPWRWLAYVGVIIAGWVVLRRASDERKAVAWPALIAGMVALELSLSWLPSLRLGDAALLAVAAAGAVVLVLGFFGSRARLTLMGMGLGLLIGAALAALLGGQPSGGLRVELHPIIFLNNRGLYYPSVLPTARFAEWMAFVAVGFAVGALVFINQRRLQEATGEPRHYWRNAILIIFGLALLGWLAVMAQPAITSVTVPIDGTDTTITLEQALNEGLISTDVALQLAPAPLAVFVPERQGLRFVNGMTLSPEFVALLLALVVYTAAFIAEIVRAGILAVPYGQLEAGRALGLTQTQMMRMIILPQALRVIIPPLTNQYLNLAKNSSLAIAISYADVYAVMNTVGNQSGQSV
ncbi:MAG TPA: ABC transporter permease subunit, partial [Candidatus Limnocylindrales bacterium]|nr:ABC transporter permease subunit [Candidatus Limnocylindrales bacterium]